MGRLYKHRGPIVICKGKTNSVGENKGMALCIVNIFDGRYMIPSDDKAACISYDPKRCCLLLKDWVYFTHGGITMMRSWSTLIRCFGREFFALPCFRLFFILVLFLFVLEFAGLLVFFSSFSTSSQPNNLSLTDTPSSQQSDGPYVSGTYSRIPYQFSVLSSDSTSCEPGYTCLHSKTK